MKVRFTLFLLAIIVVAIQAKTILDEVQAEEDEDEAPVEVKRGWKEFKAFVHKTWMKVKHFGKAVLREICDLIFEDWNDKKKLEKRKRSLQKTAALALKLLKHYGPKVARKVCESKVLN